MYQRDIELINAELINADSFSSETDIDTIRSPNILQKLKLSGVPPVDERKHNKKLNEHRLSRPQKVKEQILSRPRRIESESRKMEHQNGPRWPSRRTHKNMETSVLAGLPMNR